MNQILLDAIPELIATLVGVSMGFIVALAAERARERVRRNKQAVIILHSLSQELRRNYDVMTDILPQFKTTPFGRSFFVNTTAWDTALSTDELPEIIGFSLADTIAAHYGILNKLRYYGDLLVKVWLAPDDIQGYAEIQSGFRRIIVDSLDKAIANHPRVLEQIERALARVGRR
jgi:hypothetical protein